MKIQGTQQETIKKLKEKIEKINKKAKERIEKIINQEQPVLVNEKKTK